MRDKLYRNARKEIQNIALYFQTPNNRRRPYAGKFDAVSCRPPPTFHVSRDAGARDRAEIFRRGSVARDSICYR